MFGLLAFAFSFATTLTVVLWLHMFSIVALFGCVGLAIAFCLSFLWAREKECYLHLLVLLYWAGLASACIDLLYGWVTNPNKPLSAFPGYLLLAIYFGFQTGAYFTKSACQGH
jgi:hypothetical protein